MTLDALRPIVTALSLLLVPLAQAATPEAIKAATDQWDELLKKHVQSNGGVDYQGFSKDAAALDAFIKTHAAFDLKGSDDKLKTAVYINLYNATMIHNILRHCAAEKIDLASKDFLALEINSIKVPGGNVWNGDYKVNLAGVDVNLDNIEHDLIRGKGDGKLEPLKVKTLDPRIHAAVNCAAMSCPRVRETAYREDTLGSMLDENMRKYLSSEAQFSKIDDATLKANQIVYWYYDDFEEHGKKLGGGAGTWLAQFVTPQAKDSEWKIKHLKESFNDRGKVSLKLSSAYDFHYDWHVNDVRNRK